jgi:hypothetical protein
MSGSKGLTKVFLPYQTPTPQGLSEFVYIERFIPEVGCRVQSLWPYLEADQDLSPWHGSKDKSDGKPRIYLLGCRVPGLPEPRWLLLKGAGSYQRHILVDCVPLSPEEYQKERDDWTAEEQAFREFFQEED